MSVVGLPQPTGHWFSMPFGCLSFVTVGRNDERGPKTNAQKCYNISAIANVSDSTDRTIKGKVRKSGPILLLKMSRDPESETDRGG